MGEREQRFEQLVAEVWAPVLRYLARRVGPTDAEDLHADVLLVLWRRLEEVPPEHALPWAYRVAQGCLANSRRGQLRELRLVQRIRAERPVPATADGDEPLSQAISRLQPGEQEVLRLWAWEGLEPRELAVALEISPNTAAARLSRARMALREQLAELPRHDLGSAGHKASREEQVP